LGFNYLIRAIKPMKDQLIHYTNKLSYDIDAWDLDHALKSGEKITVIDARSTEAFQHDHIPGAVNLPHRTMSSETTSHIDKNSLVVTYCDGIGCNASTKAAIKMLKLGFRVKELIGGIDWWKRDNYPTHKQATSEISISCGCG
jgi:rhodanese-related sulfurtransferase